MSYFQGGGHNVISRRKVLPSDECTHSDRLAPAATDAAYATGSTGCPLAILSTIPDP